MKELLSLLKWENILNFLQMNLLKVIVIIVVFNLFKMLKKHVDKVIKFLFMKSNVDKSVSSFLISIYSVLYYVILSYMLIEYLGINLTAITTFLGAMGVIFGLAFKETLGNFCGGVIILTFKPFKVGDTIEYKNYVGTVKKIELFYTKIRNPQNELIIIPNGIITNTEIRNVIKNSERRLDLTVGVSYDSDLQKVKSVLRRIISEETQELVEEKKENFLDKLQQKIAVENEKKEKKDSFFSLLFSAKKRAEVEKELNEEAKEEKIENEEDVLNKLEIEEEMSRDNETEKWILPTYPPVIGVNSLGDSSVNFSILVYTKTENYLKLKLRLNERIKIEFDKEGIEIPYPQMDVHMAK